MSDPSFRGAAGVVLAHATVDDLARAALATSPCNYEVWIAYKTGANPALTSDIEARIDQGQVIDDQILNELFERHFVRAHLSAQLLEASAEVAREIADVAADLRTAGVRAGDFANELEAASVTLEAKSDPAQLHGLVQRLAAVTRDMIAHNRGLEERMQASSRQVDQQQSSLNDVRLQAETDALTGLSNRRHFDAALATMLSNAANSGSHGPCLVLGDIDHFKRINDTWGHQVGDQVIRYVAAALKMHAGTGVAARYGGEEFALILPHADLAEAASIAEAVRTKVCAKRLSKRATGEVIGAITASFGVAQYRQGDTAARLIERADACLYRAKNAGRDQVCFDRQIASAA